MNFGASPPTDPEAGNCTVAGESTGPLWAMQLKPGINSHFHISAMAIPSWQSATNESPLKRLYPSPNEPFPFHEVIFLHPLDPWGEQCGWLQQYDFTVSSPIVHICDQNLHIGVLDLTELLGFPDIHEGVAFADIIFQIGLFMADDLSLSNYDCFTDRIKRWVTLVFKRRTLGSTAQETTFSKDWDDFLSGRGVTGTRRPMNSDLFMERRSAWKFSVWPEYSVLWVDDEPGFS